MLKQMKLLVSCSMNTAQNKIRFSLFAGVPTPAICLVDSHHVRVFIVKGEQFVIPMPFQIEKVWNTKFGILIEKSFESIYRKIIIKPFLQCIFIIDQNEEKYDQNDSGTLFSLTYPLDDICPVAVSHNSTITRLSGSKYRVVYTNDNPSICMVFDTHTKEHSVYKIRKVRCDEKDYGETHSGCHSIAYNSHKVVNNNEI